MTAARRALITGSTSNIGLAIAERLARDGYVPTLNYAHDAQRADRALAAVRRFCREAALIRADVTRESDVKRMVDEATADGPVGLLINNVGSFLWKPLLDTTLDEWNGSLSSNLTSAFLCCRAILPTMRSQGEGQIINIASMHAQSLRATPNTLPYAIAKAGVILLTKTLAKTEGRHGVRVNAVSPGFVDTRENLPPDAALKVPLGRIATAAEIAAVVSFLASKQAAYVTGSVLDIHGGALL